MSILLLVGLGDSCSMDAVLTACMKKKRSMVALEPLCAFQSTRRVSEQMYFIEVFSYTGLYTGFLSVRNRTDLRGSRYPVCVF